MSEGVPAHPGSEVFTLPRPDRPGRGEARNGGGHEGDRITKRTDPRVDSRRRRCGHSRTRSRGPGKSPVGAGPSPHPVHRSVGGYGSRRWSSKRVARVLQLDVAEAITQRELRNDSGEIMRRLDQGEAFVVTRNGVPVGELIPLRRRRLVPRDHVLAAFAHAPAIDAARFRDDLDRYATQDTEPRA